MKTTVADSVSALDSSAIEQRIKDHQFVLIAPHTRDRNATMAYFLKPEFTAFYYAATDEDADPAQFAAHLTEAFQVIENTNRGGAASPDESVKRLGKDIGKTGARFVVLDEVDRLNGTPGLEVISGLRSALPSSLPIVISGRVLDCKNWQPLVDNGQAVYLDDAGDTSPCSEVEVYGFGGGTVYSDGLPVTVWDGPLPRNLFYYFTDHPLVTREEVFSTFWPDLPTKEATNVFHVTKRKVTERVGYETMIYASAFYRASPRVNMYYDVAHFETAIEQGRQNPDNLEPWTTAIALYRQPFLHRINMPWVVQRRQQLAQSYTEALIEVARAYRRNRPQEAIGYYLRALREMPHREDVHRDLIQMYAEQGHMDKVRSQYQTLETELKRKFNIAPGKATRDLYTNLISKRH